MRYLKWTVIVFVILCVILAAESGIFVNKPDSARREPLGRTTKKPILLQNATGGTARDANEQSQLRLSGKPDLGELSRTETALPESEKNVLFSVNPGEVNNITIGSTDKKSGYKFQLELTSKGAAIKRATFSEFDNRNRKNPQPLDIITPAMQGSSSEALAMSNSEFLLLNYNKMLRLENLYWQSFGPQEQADGSQLVRFEAIINERNANKPVIKISKTYSIKKDSYLLDCDMTIENLSDSEEKIRFNLNGPSGLDMEDFSRDMRAVMACYKNSKGQFETVTKVITAIAKDKNNGDMKLAGGDFIWACAINKYFAAILVPLPEEGKTYCDWVQKITGRLYKSESAYETAGVNVNTSPADLSAAGKDGSSRTYNFRLYIGPKEKIVFDKNEQYKNWGFINIISFNSCFCCPGCLIDPIAFGILAIMNWMHYWLWPHNYGIVIIILVFIMRLIIHPLTKKSQVSMSKMSKLAPKAEEIKKKYANDKAEMNKKMMELYREQGASPVMGMLPMFVQMPIWIALYSAVYSSIDLRGAEFLPFWITDLSSPDAIWTFPKVLVIPWLGWKIASINLLPILMGVAFYFQQKLMPAQTGAVSNPQMEQQQKIMKIMMPLLFPLMLYNGPSGVNLYIMASTFAGVIEQDVIRKHIQQHEEAEAKGLVSVTKKTGGKVKKKKPKPFFKS